MNLIIGLYNEPHELRRAEIRQCLLANLANPFFGRVVVIEEDPSALAGYLDTEADASKVRRIKMHQRMTFDDAFFLAAISLDEAPWVLANNDIEFDDSLAYAGNIPPGELWCLTRTELDGSQLSGVRAAWCQDAWIFRTAPPSQARRFNAGWHLGVVGCDNRLAHAAAVAGWKLRNPGRTIRALHRHASNVRRPIKCGDGEGFSVPLESL
jgi:hypothetical protein